MRNLVVAPTVIGVLLASVLLLPVPLANHDLGPAFFGVFFDDPTVTFARPTGDATKTKSIAAAPAPNAPGITPATTVTPTVFGALAVPSKIVAATDLVASVWLSASYEVPVSRISLSLQKATGSTTTNVVTLSIGGSNLLRGADGSPDVTIKPVPERFYLTELRKNMQEIDAGTLLTLAVGVTTAGVEGQALDVKLHYASAANPSGLVFGVAKDVGSLAQGYGAGIYLDDDNKLTMTEPTSRVDLARAAGNTGVTLDEAPEWEWGSVVVREKFNVVTDGIFNVSLRMPAAGTPPAGARLVLQVNVYVAQTKISGSTNYVLKTQGETGQSQAPQTPDAITVGVPIAGVEIPAGSTVKITFQLQAAQPGGTYEFLYGSVQRPSGLLFAAISSGGPALPPGSPTVVRAGTPTTGAATISSEATTSASVDAGEPKQEPSSKKTPAFTLVLVAAAVMLAVALARRRD